MIPLSPATSGIIKELPISEGVPIKAGTIVLTLNDQLAKATLQEAVAMVQQATVKRDQAKRGPEQHSLAESQQKQAIDAASTRVSTAQRQADKVKDLRTSNVASENDAETVTDKLNEAIFARNAEQLRLQEIRLRDPKLDLELADAALKQAEARKQQAEEQIRLHQLVAPMDGRILRMNARLGQTISMMSASPAIMYLPNKPFVVRCEIDQEFAHRVQVGMTAELFADNSEYCQWTGTVRSIAGWIAPRRFVLDEPFQKNDVRTLEVVVELPTQPSDLRIGQRLRVVLLTNKSSEKPAISAEQPDRPAKPSPAIKVDSQSEQTPKQQVGNVDSASNLNSPSTSTSEIPLPLEIPKANEKPGVPTNSTSKKQVGSASANASVNLPPLKPSQTN